MENVAERDWDKCQNPRTGKMEKPCGGVKLNLLFIEWERRRRVLEMKKGMKALFKDSFQLKSIFSVSNGFKTIKRERFEGLALMNFFASYI
jgi:hypothetical protein